MIIAGNSHVALFRNRLVDPQTDSIIPVKWVGALTASHFILNHSAARAVRAAFASADQWKILSIGMHDIFGLCRAYVQGRYRPVFNQLVDQYQSIFSSFIHSGKFVWLISPQQLDGPAVCGLSERSVFDIADEFNQAVSDWCRDQGIVVVNPLPMLLDENFRPPKDMVQSDGIHLDKNALETYRQLIEDQTGQRLVCRELNQSRKHRVQARTEPESLALLVADELNLEWDDSGVPPGQRSVFEQQIGAHIADRLSLEGPRARMDRDTPYNADKKLNAVDLVGIYSYASDLCGQGINFDVDIRDLDTVAKMSQFLLAQKPLTKNDFFETLKPDTDDVVRSSETFLADRRIGALDDVGWMQLKEILHHQTEGTPCQYGIFYFWLALIEAEKGRYGIALNLLENACCHRLRFPFRPKRVEDYRSTWKSRIDGMDCIDTNAIDSAPKAEPLGVPEESAPVAARHAGRPEALLSSWMNQQAGINGTVRHIYVVTNAEESLFNFDCFPNLKSIDLFVPVPETCNRLRHIYREDPRVRVWPLMLSNRTGYDLLDLALQNQQGGLSFYCREPAMAGTTISVESIGIDDFLRHHNGYRPDILISTLRGLAPRLWASFPDRILKNIKAVCTPIDRRSPLSAAQAKGFMLFGAAPLHPQDGRSMVELYVNPLQVASLTDRQAALRAILSDAPAKACLQTTANLRPDDIAQELNDLPQALFQQGMKLLQADRKQEAHFTFTKTIEMDPEHPDAFFQIGHLLHHAGQRSDARPYLKTAFMLRPYDAAIAKGYAEALQAAGYEDEAQAVCERYTAQHLHQSISVPPLLSDSAQPQSYPEPEAVEGIQSIYDLVNRGNTDEAIQSLEELLRKFPDFAQGHNDLGVLAYQIGDQGKADKHYTRAAEIEPGNALYQKNLADFLYQIKGDSHGALAIYTRLLRDNRDDTEALFAIGRISMDMGHTEDADTFFGRILEIDPDHQDAKKALGLYQDTTPTSSAARIAGAETSRRMGKEGATAEQPICVSAIVSVYNAERYLEGCLEDLLGQTIADRLEIIVVDSGSQQNEAAIVRRFQQHHRHIKYIRTDERETVYAAWNRGIKASRGEYITNANCDDRHKPDAFEIMSLTLAQRPDVALVYADCLITETENETFYHCTPVGRFRWLEWNRDDLLNRGCFMGPQPMWRRSLHDEYGYFDPDYVTSGDYEFWLRISQTHDFLHISEYLGLYLRSPQSIEHRNRDRQSVENRKLLDMYRKAAKQNLIIRRKSSPKTPTPGNTKEAGLSLLEQAVQFVEKDQYASAETILKQFIADDPDHWAAYELLVDILLQSDQESVIAEQLLPLEKRPGLPARMLALIGSGYEAAGDLSQAQHFADQALEVDLDCARAWNLKGVIAYRRSHRDEALGHFKKAADSDHGWGDPWTNMGMALWEHAATDEALACFEKGFQLSPTAPNVATTYHTAVSETGHYDRAKPLFEKIVKQHPDFLKARFLLIDVLIRLEAYPEALEQIEDVLVKFGADPQLLTAAKAVRAKVGPMTIQNHKHPSLSLCMIVKNEEKYLARCLASLKPIVDEMILVDTGSTDATRDIAEVFGAKIFDFEWNDDFSAARNSSLEKAEGDWILVMDADEVIATKDHESIRKLLKKTGAKNRAFMIVTRNYTHQYNIIGWESNTGQYREEEAGAGWVPSEKVRLFPNKESIRFEYPVHEVVGPSLARHKIPVGKCPCPVHHYGKLDQAVDRQKDERYYKIGMEKLSFSHDDPVAIREMAVQAAKLDKNEDAILLWKRLIAIEPNDPRSHINLASAYGKLKRYDKAQKAAEIAVKIAPNLKEGHLNLGLSELHLGNCAQAIKVFTKLVNDDNQYHSARFLLGASHLCNGEIEKGAIALQALKGTQVWNNLSYSLQELVESMMAADRPRLARHLIDGAERIGCSNDAIKVHKRQFDSQAA